MTAPTLEVRDLETHFFTREGVVKAVDGVSFRVGKGEVLGLVGESGSGKTITGFSILGMVDPPGRITGGEILFQGRALMPLPERERPQLRGSTIALIFTDPMMPLNPVLRVDPHLTEAVPAQRDGSTARCWGSARAGRGRGGSTPARYAM